MMQKQISVHPLYYYVSTKAECDPARTIYLCPPAAQCGTDDDARRYAESSGWQAIAEKNEAVLVVPVAANGWDAEPLSLLRDIFNETRSSFDTLSGKAVWGRSGKLFCWETLVYVAGYGDGAVFAGNATVAYPGLAAGVALVGGLPSDYSAGELTSSHVMMPRINSDHNIKNRDIPVCLWMLDADSGDAMRAVEHFAAAMRKDAGIQSEQVEGIDSTVWRSAAEPAAQVRIFQHRFESEPQRSSFIFDNMFSRIARWKEGPDGTLTAVDSKSGFLCNPRYIRHTATVGGQSYDYFVHIPSGMTAEQAKGLPLVFTLHGRGVPVWRYFTRNGWDTLADETREFILVSPDSPGNIWFLFRDGDVFETIIEQMQKQYGIDSSRVYLAGFSNGAVMAREMACYRPQLFAAISPSNGPWFDTLSMQRVDESKPPKELSGEIRGMMERFEEDGWEMPCSFFFGDSDPVAGADNERYLALMLRANNCVDTPLEVYTGENYFTEQRGYLQGSRFCSKVYADSEGIARVSVTIMKDMPHGTIPEESRYAWSLLKRFRRREGSRKVEAV